MDKNLKKDLGARLKALRKQRHWTQKELAGKLNMSFTQLNKYEGGFNIPPLNKLIQLAKIFDITLDHLLTGNRENDQKLTNLQLLERMQDLESLEQEEQEYVIKLIDAVIFKNRIEKAIPLRHLQAHLS